jgi:hypothetical protein
MLNGKEIMEFIDYKNGTFSPQSLEDIENGIDTHIDDPDLLNKKVVLGKFTPLSTVNAIIGKHKDCGITHTPSWCKNPNDEKTNLFTHYVYMTNLNIKGHSEEASKKLAQQKAC